MSGPATEGSVQQRVHRMSVGHDERLVVTSWRSVCRVVKVRSDKGFAVIVRFVFWSLCVGCAVAVLKIFEGKEILKNNFSLV
jgi:hypothetical protein